MLIGVFELFKIGIGSSSSQRIGPMIAADQFLTEIEAAGVFGELAEDVTELFGLPALAGRGHGTDNAVLHGFAGEVPDRINVDNALAIVDTTRRQRSLNLLELRETAFYASR
jgi:L-serine dehydratase